MNVISVSDAYNYSHMQSSILEGESHTRTSGGTLSLSHIRIGLVSFRCIPLFYKFRFSNLCSVPAKQESNIDDNLGCRFLRIIVHVKLHGGCQRISDILQMCNNLCVYVPFSFFSVICVVLSYFLTGMQWQSLYQSLYEGWPRST